MSAPGLRLRGAVPPKEHNHEVSGNSDTDRVRNLDLHAFTGSTVAAALALPHLQGRRTAHGGDVFPETIYPKVQEQTGREDGGGNPPLR